MAQYLTDIFETAADQEREKALKERSRSLAELYAPPSGPAPTDPYRAAWSGPPGTPGAGQQPFVPRPGQAGQFTGGLTGDLGQYAAAIRAIESGSPQGNYQARGPVQSNGDVALGAYQVMRSNLPSWSQEVLGRQVSEAEFLQNPGLQDAIFKAKFGGNVDRYGNPYDAASIWFTGQPRGKAGNVADSLGTTAPAYLQKFEGALADVLGGPQPVAQPAPVQPGVPRSRFDHSNMDPGAIAALARLEQATGRTFDVSSAYRDPEHNERVGGARHSQHVHGRAFDIPVHGMSQAEQIELIRAARRAGFNGIGVYGGSLHFDTRSSPAAWGPSYGSDTLPAWAADAALGPLDGLPHPSGVPGGLPPGRAPFSGSTGLPGGKFSGRKLPGVSMPNFTDPELLRWAEKYAREQSPAGNMPGAEKVATGLYRVG